MYSIVDKKLLHPSLLEYLNTPFVKSFRLVGNPPHFTFTSNDGVEFRCPGIHSTLRRKFYPRYKVTRRRRFTKKKGSTMKQGKKVDDDIFQYIKTGKRPRHWMSKMLIDYVEKTLKHTFQVSQLPVYIPELKCATQVDMMTMDRRGTLHFWELKTGYPPGGSIKKGVMLGNVPITTFNQWELQRAYSCLALSRTVVDISLKNSCVVNVYNERAKNSKVNAHRVRARKHPVWVKKIK